MPYSLAPGQVISQQVWGLQYIDELVQTGLNSNPFGQNPDNTCDTFYYAMHDANYNVLGLADSEGTLAERYEYSPYGQRTVYTPAGSNDPLASASIGESRRWTVDGEAQPWGLNDFGHQGLMHDKEFDAVYNRRREYIPRLGRFAQRDPAGYNDGPSVYAYHMASPISTVDPSGLSTALGNIIVDSKQMYTWTDQIRHPEARHWWDRAAVYEQKVDFELLFRTDIDVSIDIIGVGPPKYQDYQGRDVGPNTVGSGSIVKFKISQLDFMLPYGGRVRGALSAAKGDSRKALNGKLCRKSIFVRQWCCVEKDNFWYGFKRKRWTENEDHYVRVYLVGKTWFPGGYDPGVHCNTDEAEKELGAWIAGLNNIKFNMCDQGLPSGSTRYIQADDGFTTERPSGAIGYVKGDSSGLAVWDREVYR